MWITVLVCISIGTCVVSSVCPSEWIQHSSSCYYFSKEALPWEAAHDFCREFSSELTDITSKDENDFLEHIASQNYVKLSNTTPSGKHIYGFWTGGRSIQPTGWYWSGTGNRFNFTDWFPGEPNNGFGVCMHITSHLAFHWNDYFCPESEYFICETSKLPNEVGGEIVG